MKFAKRFLQYLGVAAVVVVWILVIQKFAPFGAANSGNLKASAWIDQNTNGIKDAGEPPLSNVCIWYSLNQTDNTPPSNCIRTDETGNWNDLFQGGPVQVGSTVHYFAVAPDGYRLTTPNVFDSSNPNFGFAPLSPAANNSFPSSLVQNDLGQFIQSATPWILGALLIIAAAYFAWQNKDNN